MLLNTLFFFLTSTVAYASSGLGEISFSLLWCIPFAFILLSIATGPIFFHHLWEEHQGKILFFLSLIFVFPFILYVGPFNASFSFLETILLEYIPFMALIFSLFVVAGGVLITGHFPGTPLLNTLILAFGSVLSGIIGTTGSSIVLIRPILRANQDRKFNTHIVIFFIFIVSNIGGALSPLGDPPLFLGFLKGVDFFWPIQNMFFLFLFLTICLLGIFFVLDTYFYRKEPIKVVHQNTENEVSFQIHGKINLFFLLTILITIIASSLWKNAPELHLSHISIPLNTALRDLTLFSIGLLSLFTTHQSVRAGNEFNWTPILEVAKVFLALFICIIPVMAILKEGLNGSLSSLVLLTQNTDSSHNPFAFFWITGLLSSFLDNAPTYLIFFEIAGGDAVTLMTEQNNTLKAISAGSVFMGALTYIGNAPNFMIYSIAKNWKIKMPSFFGYLKWSFPILIPFFLILSFLFF